MLYALCNLPLTPPYALCPLLSTAYLYPMTRITELEAMLDESPNDPFLIYALAREYEKTNGTMQALLMYEHLVTNYPDYIATYYHYAKLLFGAGNRPEAIKLLQQGIERSMTAKDMHAAGEMRGLLMGWTEEE
jgi:tetratricopeptide (TPR) repeat protein